jgi:hypothetical protein
MKLALHLFSSLDHSSVFRRILLLLVFTVCFISGASADTWEFDGTTYAYQKAHFDSATKVIQSKLGIQMHSFGAPYNQIDATLIQVMSEDTNYHVLMLGQNNPTGTSINLTKRVQIENGTGIPDYAYFRSDYDAKKPTYTTYMIMQGHPYAWTTTAKQTEFHNIINFLISEGVEFMTPYEYFIRPNGRRPGVLKVILKFDDLRATSTYFTPCFQAYDFLVANKVKAGFGVNWMWNLTQPQIDTLNYYLQKTDDNGDKLFEIWNHGLDHSMNASTTGGLWSSPSTWASGMVPTSADDAVIEAGTTVTIDVTNAVCQNLTINGTLEAKNTGVTSLTVNGDLLITSTGMFTPPYLSTGTGNIVHTLTVYGDFTNSGGNFDFRTGSSGTTMRVINTSFVGNTNSVITVGTYSSSNNCFNGITINKTGGAKVVCASDVYMDQGASTCKSELYLTSGIVETGSYSINCLSLTSADLVGGSTASYVAGALGRGMSNSSGKLCFFPVGDANGYRPISIKSTTAGVGSGHFSRVRYISGNANTGSSAFVNGIDKVSQVRYYSVSYNKGIGSGAASMTYNHFYSSYGSDDGVTPGNTNLRVAYSTDNRVTWRGLNQTISHTTSLTSPPTTIIPDSLTIGNYLTLNSGTGYIYVALARVAGTTENSLQPSVSLTLTTLIDGFYDGASMISDIVKVELHNSTSPYALVDSNSVVLNSAGAGSFNFTNAVNGTPYFIVVKHRNAVETWSASTVTFVSGAANYNFTSTQTQAYGSNMVLVGSKWCLFNGDVNQDGSVDGTDLGDVDNDNNAFVTGYSSTDLNGDNTVDGSDLGMVDNNNNSFVASVVPAEAPSAIHLKKPGLTNSK